MSLGYHHAKNSQIQAWGFGRPVQSLDATLALPVGDQSGKLTWHIVILKIELMLEQLLCWWHHAQLHICSIPIQFCHVDRSIDNLQPYKWSGAASHAASKSFPSEGCSPSGSGTSAWILLQETSSHTCGTGWQTEAEGKCFHCWTAPTPTFPTTQNSSWHTLRAATAIQPSDKNSYNAWQ